MSKKQLLTAIEEFEGLLDSIYRASLPGEPYHPGYETYKEVFELLVKSDKKTERMMSTYFSRAAKRVIEQIDWNRYAVLTADEIDDMMDIDWDGEQLNIKVTLTESLVEAVRAGGMFSEFETNVDLGWNETFEPAVDFLDKHTTRVSKSLNKTSERRLRTALRQSISNGENITEATRRVNAVINNKKRAAVIAHTESVRAFSEGRIEAGALIGADRKQWDATLGACHICRPLDGMVVGLKESFNSIIGSVFSPPAHPNCRCLTRLLMPGQDPIPTSNAPIDFKNDKTRMSKYLQVLNVKATQAQAEAAQIYQAGGFNGVNAALRRRTSLTELQSTIDELDKLMKKNKTSDTMTVYRGLSLNKNLKPNMQITDKAYASTSLDRGIGLEFVKEASGQKPYLLEITVPKGSKGVFLGEVTKNPVWREEFEFLLPRSTTLVITEVVEEGKWQVAKAVLK